MFAMLPLAIFGSTPHVIPQTVRAPVCTAVPTARATDAAPQLWLVASRAEISPPDPDRRASLEPRVTELWRAPDGLFYVDGRINGHPIRFVVDTGASMVVLTAADARRAHVTIDTEAEPLEANTVTGRSRLARVVLASMQVGDTDAIAAPAAVADEGLGVSLLGQSWLAQLASVTIEGDRMRLR